MNRSCAVWNVSDMQLGQEILLELQLLTCWFDFCRELSLQSPGVIGLLGGAGSR